MAGWERVFNNEYGEYFVNHITKTAQFKHPGSMPNPVSGEQHAQALAVSYHQKLLGGAEFTQCELKLVLSYLPCFPKHIRSSHMWNHSVLSLRYPVLND